MQNKDIDQKILSEIKFNKLLKKRIRTIIIKNSLYDFLTILTPFRNLVNVTLQECRFNWVKEFSALHHLQVITLSRNYVANTTELAWEWLELNPISSNLELLKTKNNLLISPFQITCLKNDTQLILRSNLNSSSQNLESSPVLSLDLSHNMLGRLKQSIWEWLMQTTIRNNFKKLDMNYDYFTALPMQIDCIKNLHILISCENEINFLPKEFGTLLQRMTLYLSDNLIRTHEHSAWKWLETPIRDYISAFEISYNFLTKFPLQVIYMKNLHSLDISENEIDFLPKELGALPHLSWLNLSSNYLGKSHRNTWEWLEQAPLTELPPQIGKLSALISLKLIENKLKRLPQTITHLMNLEDLDLFENDLLYLPGNMIHLSADIDVDDNPFNFKDDDLTTNLEVPSLMDCSAEVIMKSGLNYTNVLPQTLVEYLDEEKYMEKYVYCFFCGTPYLFYYEKRFIKYSDYDDIMNIKFYGTTNIINASFECYACSPECARILKI